MCLHTWRSLKRQFHKCDQFSKEVAFIVDIQFIFSSVLLEVMVRCKLLAVLCLMITLDHSCGSAPTICTEDGKSTAPDWYLTSDGSDTVNCGQTISTGCKSLSWLLARFYTSSYRTNRTLSLVTDCNVKINKQIVKEYPWIATLDVVTSAVNTVAENNVQVEFLGVTFDQSEWKIQGLNLVMKKAFLPNTKIYINKGLNLVPGLVNITKSTFGYLNICSGFHVIVSDCYIDGTTRLQSTLIDVTKSDISVTKSIFYRNKAKGGPAVINAVFSRVIVKDVVFFANIGAQGLIQISKGGDVYVENSLFRHNGKMNFLNQSGQSAVIVKSNSVAMVHNCSFVGNHAHNGSCLFVREGSKIVVTNSLFENNSALHGGAIYCQGWDTKKFPARLQKPNSVAQNDSPKTYTSITNCVIIGSTFKYNASSGKGGALYFKGAFGKIVESSFSEFGFKADMISFGDAIEAVDESGIEVVNSTFQSRTNIRQSVLSIQNATFLETRYEF